MSDAPQQNPASPVSASAVDPSKEFHDRESWFTTTPDPWIQTCLLQHGGDRTYATTIQRMIVNARTDQHATLEAKLVQALANPEITLAGRQFVCRMLGLIGSATCVPQVASLLRNAQTADLARTALDFIPDQSVDDAYRAALGQLRGGEKIGLIGSMASRGNRQALGLLRGISSDAAETADVRKAAARAVEELSKGVES